MLNSVPCAFTAAAKLPEVYKETVDRVRQHLRTFLRPQENVLLCFQDWGEYSPGKLFAQAVVNAEAVPVLWESDYRWQALLKLAFSTKASAIIGPPLVVLGLSKLARSTGTPLSVRNVLLAGSPSEDWMIEGIQNGLDAKIWGCYDPVPGLMVGGFSCGKSLGVHMDSHFFKTEVISGIGQPALDEELGEIVLTLPDVSSACYYTGERGRICRAKCACGNDAPRLLNFQPGTDADPVLVSLQERLLSWSSVLDYRAEKTDAGLDLEVVCFPGVRLPELPSCARRLVRHWNPKQDVPFCL